MQYVDQPVPAVSLGDVDRIVQRDFPPEQLATVVKVLNEYGSEKWECEPIRVRLAALKLAQGDLEALKHCIRLAKQDYRDVIAPAEYPGYSRMGFRVGKLAGDAQAEIIGADWRQYESWLRTGA